MRCGTQETCGAYLEYEFVNRKKEKLDHGEFHQMIEIVSIKPSVYQCKAIENQECSVIHTLNLLERISFEGGKK